MMANAWLLGSLGLVLVEGSYLPQIVRLHRLKRADDVSLLFPALNMGGRFLALGYALSSGQSVFVFGFLAGILVRGTLLCQVAWYRWIKRTLTARLLPAHAGGRP